MHYHSTLVPIRKAFDHIGELEFDINWTGDEAAAIAPGRRACSDRRVWKRGRLIWAKMITLIESERLPIVLHMNECRVRYGAIATAPITNLYPSPTNDPDIGFVELGDQDICYALADIGMLPKPKSKPKAVTGPKERYGEFRTACISYFRDYGFAQDNASLRSALIRLGPDLNWPRKTRQIEIINQARDQVMHGPIAIKIAEK